MRRFKITHVPSCDSYIILDRLKMYTPIKDKRYTKIKFDTPEQAQGYLFGKGIKI